MKAYEKLLLENKAWAQEKLQIDGKYFENMSKGQHPGYLWIGCSDSRISANEITNSETGEIFVHRNIANLVSHTDLNLLSVLQYAVEELEVNHIIICGHYGCSGIKASMDMQHHGLMNKWLWNIKNVYRQHTDELSGITDQEKRSDRLSELNVKEQVLNLAETSIIQHAWGKQKKPCLHGWIYDMKSGLIKDILKMDHNSEIEDIYKFNFNRNPDHYGFY
jgi:carbonic anhydrase